MALHQQTADVGDWVQRIQAIGIALAWLLPAPIVVAAVGWLNSASTKQTVLYTGLAIAVSAFVVGRRPRTQTPPPTLPSPDSTLAMLRDMGFRFDRAAIDPDPPQLNWRQLEERFRQIQGEVEVIWHRYPTGPVAWYVYSSNPNGGRIVERFLNEARTAGRLVADLPVQRKFPSQTFEDYADHWLNIVAALLDSEMQITGSGRDERGQFTSAVLEKVVDASQLVCGRLANQVLSGLKPEPPPQASSPPIEVLRPYEKASDEMRRLADDHAGRIQALVVGKLPDAPETAETVRGLGTLPPRTIHLSWHQEPTGLHIDAIDLQPETIHDFKLWVTDVQKYSKTHNRFVEVEMFHGFVELQLWSETKTQATQIGGVTKLFSGTPVTFNFINRDADAIWFRGRTRDASVELKPIREAGTWQVTLRCEVGERHRIERLVFEWPETGRAPRPQTIVPPTQITSAVATTATPSQTGAPTPDPDAKDQAFADVLTERYSYALHNVLHWNRFAKGNQFDEQDAREWHAMEQEWTNGVRELLKEHGCNQQIQAQFRDLFDVPYQQLHHFRYMSEPLSMFSLRLKHLKKIINHYATIPILD